MKYKKLMLVTFVLLAILTLGAVNAADVSDSDGLAVDDVGGSDSVASPVNDVDLLSYDEGAGSDDLGNGTDSNDDVTDPDDEGGNDEEDSFEVWVDNGSEGFDVSAPDLSGYFIGSVTVPENMNGNISIITENDEFLFNKALNDFGSNYIRENIYDITLSDNGRYIFEGVEDGTLFRFAFLDDGGNEQWGSSDYKLVIEGSTIWLQLNDDKPEVELENLIMDADEGSTLFLDKDYIFSGPIEDYTSIGISIGKAMTIDGQGHTIDANNYCTIFAIDSPGITLTNIIFRNGHVSDDWSGGALGGGNSDLSIVNCTFENNIATDTDNAGAIAMMGDNIAIINSTFINNEGYNMGSILISGNGALISNCVFRNNRANPGDESETKGGAIFIGGESATITGCVFINNTADLGSDIYIVGSSENFIIESCNSDAGDSSVYFAEGDEGGDDEFDPTKFSIDRRDDENNVLAFNVPVFSLYCPDGSEGTVEVTVSYNGNDYSVSRNLSDVDENNYLHWYLNELNMTFLVKYGIHVNVNDGEFESDLDAYVHEPISFTEDKKSYINTLFDGLDIFVFFEVPSEYDDATVIVEVEGKIFNKTLKEFEHADDTNADYYWFHPSYGPGPGDERFKHYIVENGVFGGMEAKAYNVTANIIFVNSPTGNHTFTSITTIEVVDGGIVENKDVIMEVSHQENFGVGNEYETLVLIRAPDGANGTVTVSLDGNVIFESDLDKLDSEDGYYVVRPSNLELDSGDYELTFAYFEGDEKIVETTGTFSFFHYGDDADDGVVIWVREGDDKEFDLNDEDDLSSAFAYVSVSNDLDGTIVFYCFDGEEDDEQDFFHMDLSDVNVKYADEERDGFTIYEISFNSFGDKLADFKGLGWFRIAFVTNYGEDESREVDSREYNIDYDDEANIIKIWQAEGGDDEPILDEIELNFIEDDGDLIFEMSNNTHVANLLIPDLEEFEGTVVNIIVRKNDKVVQEISTSDIEREDLPAAHRYPICIDLTKFDDIDAMDIEMGCFDHDGRNLWEFVVEVKGDTVILHSAPEEEYYVFYGNITTRDLNDPSLMGPHPNNRLFSVTIPDLNITEGSIVVSYDDSVIEYSLGNCSHDRYENIYWVNLDDFDLMTLPENEIITFTFSYADKSLTFKRIRQGDYLYKVLTPDDFDWQGWSNFKFEISDMAYAADGSVGRIIGNSNMQSIYIDFGGGYFDIYVNDVKIEGLNYVLSLENLRNSIDDGGLDLTFSMLDITKSGQYNIKIVHVQSGGEYFYGAETELVNKSVLVDFGGLEENSTIEISDIEFTYGESGSAKVTLVGAKDIIASVVGHDEANVTFADGKLTVSGLDAGNYTLKITTVPEEGYSATTKLVNITVNKADIPLTVEVNVTTVGQKATVYISVRAPSGALVKLKRDGNTYEAISVFGAAYYEFYYQNAGPQTVTVRFEGDNNYNPAENNATFNIDKFDSPISIDIPKVEYTAFDNFQITIGNVTAVNVTINNKAYAVKSDGTVDIDTTALDADTYTVVAFNEENDVYKANSTSKSFTIVKKASEVSIDVGQSYNVGDDFTIGIDNNTAATVTINNAPYEIKDGKVVVDTTKLAAGEYTVVATIAGNGKYIASSDTASFKINKITPSIVITAGEAIEGSDLTVEVSIAGATGVVNINGENITLTDAKATTTFTDLIAGNMVVNVVYYGDVNYLNASNSLTVPVKAKQNAGLKLFANDIYVGETVTIAIVFNVNITGKVTIEGNEVGIANGKGTYNISGLTAGEHTVTAIFAGDKYFNAETANVTFNVNKWPSQVSVKVDKQQYSVGDAFDITVVNNTAAVVTINNNHYEVKDGKVVIDTTKLAAGEYTVVATIAEDDKYLPDSSTVTFKVAKVEIPANSTTILVDGNAKESKTPTYSINLPSDATGTLTVTINGKNYTANVVNGKADVKVSDLKPGNYKATITYSGDDKYSPIVKTTTSTVVVDPKVVATQTSVLYTGKYSVTVYGKDGKVAKSQAVKFYINGKYVKTVKTNSKGVATFNIHNKYLPNKKYTVKAVALGKTASKKVTVKQILTLKTVKVKKSGKLVLTANVKKVNGYFPKGKITFRFRGNVVKTVALKNGVAKVTVPSSKYNRLAIGSTVKYSATYLKTTVQKKTKVIK